MTCLPERKYTMKKLLLTLMLTAVSTGTMAEWVEIISSPEDGVALYVDPSAIHKSGNMVKMWELMDTKTGEKGPDDDRFYSLTLQREYNCKNKQVRVLHTIGFSELAGKGDKIIEEKTPEAEWRPIEDDNDPMKKMWELACEK